MNYTKLVREYCKNNSGAIFDVSKLKDTEFAEVPYKTLFFRKTYSDIYRCITLIKICKNRSFNLRKPQKSTVCFIIKYK